MEIFKKHVWLCVILVGYLALGLWYANVIPIFEAPDEPAYFEHAQFLKVHRTLPSEPSPHRPGHVQTAGHPPLYPFIGALLLSTVDTSAYAGWKRNPYFSYGTDSLGHNVFQHTSAEDFPYSGVSLGVHLLRLLSLVLGAGTIIATYILARIFDPTAAWLAIAASAFVAFLPQFVFMSSIVNSDNLVNLLGAVSMIQILRIGLGQSSSTRAFVVLGLLVGLANLAKGSAIFLLPLSALAIGMGSRQLARSELLKKTATAIGVFFGVAGWWYLRNILLYGDPLALNWRRIAYPEALRQTPVRAQDLWDFASQMGASFWARFGWANIIPDERVYLAFAVLFALAVVGLVLRFARERGKEDFPRTALILLSANVLIVSAQVLSLWYNYPVGGDQGRYLFTALPALAVLLMYGLGAWLPNTRRWMVAPLVGVGMLSIAAFIPVLVLSPAHMPYVPPAAITTEQIPATASRSHITFGDAVRVTAFSAPPVFRRGATENVRVYWQAAREILTDNNVTLSLKAEDGRVLWHRSRRPGRGLSPTDLWRKDSIIPDLFAVRVPPDAPVGPAVLVLQVSEREGRPWRTVDHKHHAVLAHVTIE